MNEPAAVVLSPHLDDAVFSAWHVLTGRGPVRVVTVFAGIPEPGVVTALDRAHGATESADWMRRRIREDSDVHALTGCESVTLNLLDVQYRAHRVPELRDAIESDPTRFIPLVTSAPGLPSDVRELHAAVAPWLPAESVVYASAGIGGHPDHRDVGRLAVELARQGRQVRLYGDSPYFLRHGLPRWIGGAPSDETDAAVDDALRVLSPTYTALSPRPVDLGLEEAGRKIQAARRYRTEFRFIDDDFQGVASDPERMRYEAWWALG